MTEFGTMVDFDELLKGVKQRDMKMILGFFAYPRRKGQFRSHQ